jgi:SAM-dependent methyltransferase
MVTLPPPPPSADAAHRHREFAESFGADADNYDRSRPHYPIQLVESIAKRIAGRSILDVGIGTGISAEPFRGLGFDVLGVEADPQMAKLARAKGLSVEISRFEEWDAAGRTFDAVIAGQTWHWVDPEVGAAKAASVLRSGAILGLFWNSALPAAQLAAEFATVFDSLDTGLPFNPWRPSSHGDPYGPIIEAASAALSRTGAFAEVERLSFDWTATLDRGAWLAQAKSAGGINRLPLDTLNKLLTGMGAAVDAAGGNVVLNYTSIAAVAERLSPND